MSRNYTISEPHSPYEFINFFFGDPPHIESIQRTNGKLLVLHNSTRNEKEGKKLQICSSKAVNLVGILKHYDLEDSVQ